MCKRSLYKGFKRAGGEEEEEGESLASTDCKRGDKAPAASKVLAVYKGSGQCTCAWSLRCCGMTLHCQKRTTLVEPVGRLASLSLTLDSCSLPLPLFLTLSFLSIAPLPSGESQQLFYHD